MKKFAIASILTLVLVLITVSGYAQGITTGVITGVVVDQQGAVVAGATVAATDDATGSTVSTVSQGNGAFQFPTVPVGTYSITITSTSFAPSKLTNVGVTSGIVVALGKVTLKPGTSETVTVEGGVPLLETSQSQVTTTFDAEEVSSLPTGGGLDELTLLIPGVANVHDNNRSNTNGVGFSVNGERGRSNNFEIDGQANNDNSVAGPQVFFQNEDAIQEIQVITNDYSAEYGRNMGSVVNYITKSGTNSIHGSAVWIYTGSWLSSATAAQKDPQFTSTPGVTRFTDNQVEGTLNMPIIKDKLWASGSALRGTYLGGPHSYASSRPYMTPSQIATAQTFFTGNPNAQAALASIANEGPYGVSYGNPTQYTAGTPSTLTFCAAAVTTCGTNPSVTIANVYPVYRIIAGHSYDEEFMGRLDYQLGPKDRLFARYIYQNDPSIPGGGTYSTGAFYDVLDRAHSIGSDWTHTFNPNVVNTARYSFQQTVLEFDNGGFSTCTDNTIGNCPSTITISSGLGSYGLANNIPQGRVVKVTQAQDNAHWTYGNHSFAFGGEWDYQNSPNVFLPYIDGGFTFSNFNYMLAGSGTGTLTSGNPNIHFTEPDWAGYFQDSWKAAPSLTLNMGLRYEYFGQSANLLNKITTAQQTGPSPFWLTSLPLSKTTFPYIQPNYKNIEPRFGFAWNPDILGKKMVLRGGFAINVDPAYYNIALNSYGAAPVVNQASFTCNGTSVNCLPAGGTTGTLVHAQDNAYNPTGVDPGTKNETWMSQKFKNPYSENYTLSLQYQFARHGAFEIGYAGNHTIGNFQSINGNPVLSSSTNSPATDFPSLYPAGSYCTTSTLAGGGDIGHALCGYTNARLRANTAFSIYNGLQSKITLQGYHGWSGTVGYTYSRTIDNTSEVYGTAAGGATNAFSANPQNVDGAERGVSGDSFTNVIGLGLTYKVPFYQNSTSFMGKLLGGFQLNSLYNYNSGQPYSIQQYYASLSSYATTTTSTYSECDRAFDLAFSTGLDNCRPILANASAPVSVGINTGSGKYVDYLTGVAAARTSFRWIVNNRNEALALGTPFPGVGRNTLRGNTYNNTDMSIFKDTKFEIHDHTYVTELQIVAFNALNRAYYGTPGSIIDEIGSASAPSPYTGLAANSLQNFYDNGGFSSNGFGSGSRNVQLAFKVKF